MQDVDEVLCRIRLDLNDHPDENHKSAILDTQFKQHLQELNLEGGQLPQNLEKYFDGRLPEHHGKKWEDVDFLYIPAHVGGNHWVAVEINLAQWKVTVYDCNEKTNSSRALREELSAFYKDLPKMMGMYENLAKKYPQKNPVPFTFGRAEGLAQNTRM